MEDRKLIKSFERYIDNIIVPKFSDIINSYDIKKYADYRPIFIINFNLKETDDVSENTIEDEVMNMKSYFGITDSTLMVNFDFGPVKFD